MLEKVATRTAHLTLAHILAMGGNAAAHLLLPRDSVHHVIHESGRLR